MSANAGTYMSAGTVYPDPSAVSQAYIKDPDTGEVLVEYYTDGTLKSISANVVAETINRQFVTKQEKYVIAKLSAKSIMVMEDYDSDMDGIVDMAQVALRLDPNGEQAKTWNLKQDQLDYTPEDKANKGVQFGYAPLNIDTKIDPDYLYDVLWDSIQNRPSSTADQIDDAVDKKHLHPNKNALNKLDVGSTGLPIWDESVWPYNGDMQKATYDQDGDGIIDHAKTAYSVTWSGLVNGPSSNPTVIDDAVNKRHFHNNLDALSLVDKDDNDLPLWNGIKWPYDMKKSIYDQDNDGIVDLANRAKSIEWKDIIDKPESEPVDIDDCVMKTHEHSNQESLDTINENDDKDRLTYHGKELAFKEDVDDKIVIDSESLTTRFSVDVDRDSRSIQLVNDLRFPEANMYYGTDDNQNRGFHKLPDVTYKQSGSIKIDGLNRISLTGDAIDPGILTYYGTDDSGNKGFYPFPNINVDYTLPAELDASIIKEDDSHRFVSKEDLEKLDLISTEDIERIKMVKGNVVGNGTRQCIISKSSNMFTLNGSDLIVKASDEDPITVSFSKGKFKEIIRQVTENLTVSNLPSVINNGTAYIFLYIDLQDENNKIKIGKTIHKPIYSNKRPSASNEGQYWFNIDTYTMYLSTGYTFMECENPTLFIGEVSAANGKASMITYACNGYYDSGWYDVTYNTTYNKNHEIGTDLVSITTYRGLNGVNLGQFSFTIHGSNTITDATPLGDRISSVTDTYIRTTRYSKIQSGNDTIYNGSNQHRVILKRLW